MHLDLSEESSLELLELVAIGNFVRNAVREAEGRYEAENDALEALLLEQAAEAGVLPSGDDGEFEDEVERLRRAAERTIGDFVEDEFWYELETRLAERDFDREPVETREAYAARYVQEFQTFGLDRLEVNNAAPVSDLRQAL